MTGQVLFLEGAEHLPKMVLIHTREWTAARQDLTQGAFNRGKHIV